MDNLPVETIQNILVHAWSMQDVRNFICTSRRVYGAATEIKNKLRKFKDVLQQLVLKCPNKRWNWKELSMNPKITAEFAFSNMHLPWDINCLIEKKISSFNMC